MKYEIEKNFGDCHVQGVLYWLTVRRGDWLFSGFIYYMYICLFREDILDFSIECMFWWVQSFVVGFMNSARTVNLLLLCALHWPCVPEASWQLRDDLESRQAWAPCCDWSLSEHWCHFPCPARVWQLAYDRSWQPASRERCPAYCPSWNIWTKNCKTMGAISEKKIE